MNAPTAGLTTQAPIKAVSGSDNGQVKSASAGILRYQPAGEDYGRIGAALGSFTADKGAPAWQPLSFAFRAVAEDGTVQGELIGTTIWGQTEINMLHVAPEWRGQGVGKDLVKAAEDFAKSAHEAVSIKVWTPSFQGEGFYERAGFSESARLPLNTEGLMGGAPQYNILYQKRLTPDIVAMARAGQYADIAAYANAHPERVLAQLDEAAAADPNLGKGLTPYFSKARFLELTPEDIALRLEIKAIPRQAMKRFEAESQKIIERIFDVKPPQP